MMENIYKPSHSTIVKHLDVWQMSFLSSMQFASFVSTRGIQNLPLVGVERLWQIGLLKSDFVSSETPLGVSDLMRQNDLIHGQYTYIDNRDRIYVNGLTDVLQSLPQVPKSLNLWFHPFRFLMCEYLNRILAIEIPIAQLLFNSTGCEKRLHDERERITQWTQSGEGLKYINRVENMVDLSVATEPCVYLDIFHINRTPSGIDADEWSELITNYRKEIIEIYQRLGIDEIRDIHSSILSAAYRLDRNSVVHRILRLTSGEMRMTDIRGDLGGAMLLITMAEVIRRFSEQVFNTPLSEEDDFGHGEISRMVKKENYGDERLYDGNKRAVNAFMRNIGLNYGVLVRWYVEGNTEFGALKRILGQNSSIQIINLKGQVSEKRNKGVTFRENLIQDIDAQIFSVVSIDGDRESDHLRAVKKAALDDEICGAFFVSKPNFEAANFDMSEIEEILSRIALENGAAPEVLQDLSKIAMSSSDVEQLRKQAMRKIPQLNQCAKDEIWGEILAEYALENNFRERPISKSVNFAWKACASDHLYTKANFRVSPVTGMPVER